MSYRPRFANRDTDDLMQAVARLKNADDAYQFFEDVCTIAEIQAMAQRLAVAHMLKQGMKYADIQHATGASTATISRVNRCLLYGAGGYQKALELEE